MRATSIPLKAAVHRFMDTDRMHGLSRTRRRQYEMDLGILVDNNPGLNTADLRAHHLQECLSTLRAGTRVSRTGTNAGGRKPGRGDNALNQDRTILRVFSRWLQDEGYLVGNPAHSIQTVKVGEQRRFEDWVLNADQVDQVLDAAARRHPRDHMMVCLGVYGGLRDSEMCDLQWADISFRTGTMDFYRRKQSSRTRLPINAQLMEALRTYYDWYTKEYGPVDPNWYVLPSRWNSPAKSHAMSHGWKLVPHKQTYSFIRDVKIALAVVGMGKENQGVHVLRRTFGWMLLQATGDIRDVMVALGHRSQQTTEEYLFRNVEADRLVARYQGIGFHLGNQPATPAGDNVVSLSSRRRTA